MALHTLVYYAVLAALFVAAFRWGGWPEWGTATVMVVAVAATIALRPAWAVRGVDVEFGVFAVDLIVLAAFVTIALKADRWWPLWIAGLQILATCAHLAKLLNPALGGAGYVVMRASSAHLHEWILAIGIAFHLRRTRRRRAVARSAGSSATLTGTGAGAGTGRPPTG